jgi:hypothetical protein
MVLVEDVTGNSSNSEQQRSTSNANANTSNHPTLLVYIQVKRIAEYQPIKQISYRLFVFLIAKRII